MIKPTFPMRATYFKTFEELYERDIQLAADYMWAIMDYGLYGIPPAEDDDIWPYVVTAFDLIDEDKEKAENSN